MFDKSMRYISWTLLIAGLILAVLYVTRIIQAVTTGTTCFRSGCASAAKQPDVYWIYIFMYSIVVVVSILFVKRTWKEIHAIKQT